MQKIERKMMIRLIEGKDVNCRYRYRWLPDCIIHRILDCTTRFKAPYSLRSHYLELPTT